jgi:hypothetical protein
MPKGGKAGTYGGAKTGSGNPRPSKSNRMGSKKGKSFGLGSGNIGKV